MATHVDIHDANAGYRPQARQSPQNSARQAIMSRPSVFAAGAHLQRLATGHSGRPHETTREMARLRKLASTSFGAKNGTSSSIGSPHMSECLEMKLRT
ncbi:hypothetical protein MY10362_002715 [Beauveria mimosiformis]